MLKLFSYIYGFIIKIRNLLYDNNSIKTINCKTPVISIGNISVGGTGKTPFTISLGHILTDNQIKFAVVGKGYKRKSKGEVIVSNGKELLANAKTAGDEMLLIAQSLSTPVITNEYKYLAALKADNLFNIDCILVDDGFQHRKLHRDLNIVIIDDDTLKENYLLPAGRLREPFNSLNRADVIVLKDIHSEKTIRISHYFQNKILITGKTIAGKPYNLITKDLVKNYKDTEFIALSGIAKPQNFITLLKNLQVNIKKSISFEDHHNYTKQNISMILNSCNELSIKTIAVTEKDAVKLLEFGNVFADSNIKCCVFPISIQIENGKDILIKKIINTLNK